jgi:uncharacterized UPF0160 family protein
MSIETRLADAYCKFLAGIDWSDKLVVAGSQEGRNKFLSNAFLSMFPCVHKYHRTHLISEAALRQLESKNYEELVYEHLVPKSRYIHLPCEELAERRELTTEFVKAKLEKYWRLATITKSEDSKLHRLAMPENWDGINVLARYEAVGIQLQANPYYPAEPAVE